MKKKIIAAALAAGLLLTASSCDPSREIEDERAKCEAAGGVFHDSQADDGSDVYSCVA